MEHDRTVPTTLTATTAAVCLRTWCVVRFHHSREAASGFRVQQITPIHFSAMRYSKCTPSGTKARSRGILEYWRFVPYASTLLFAEIWLCPQPDQTRRLPCGFFREDRCPVHFPKDGDKPVCMLYIFRIKRYQPKITHLRVRSQTNWPYLTSC